jgi:hypothetical protein
MPTLMSANHCCRIRLSEIPLNYKTVKTTKGRIGKGLLAIPVSLIDLFPKSNGFIYLVDDDGVEKKHHFTARDGSTRECRIGTMKQFYCLNDGSKTLAFQAILQFFLLRIRICAWTIIAKVRTVASISRITSFG